MNVFETRAARLKARGRCCDYPSSKPHKICYFRNSLSRRLKNLISLFGAEIALVILVPIVIIMIGLS